MRRLKMLTAVVLLASCDDPAAITDEAMVDMASELGRLTADVEFTDLHVRDDVVCGYADGQRFYSMVAGGNRLSVLVDQDMPEPAVEIIARSFVTCMNKGRRLDEI